MTARFVFLPLIVFSAVLLAPGAFGQGIIIGGVGGPGGMKNQAFSAEQLWINDRVLADGNHIHQETHGKIFRDTEGRQRTERELPVMSDGVTRRLMVTIDDPLRRANIMLDELTRTATVNYFPDPAARKNVPSPTPLPLAATRIETKREDLG